MIAPNIPAIYEAHFGVPMAGAVHNCINIRLNATTITFLLGHSSAEVVIVDQEFFSLAEEALKIIADEKRGHFRTPKELLNMKIFSSLEILSLLGSPQRMSGRAFH